MRLTRPFSPPVLALLIGSTLGGCADATPDDDLDFRDYEGYGDFSLFTGAAAGDDDCDIWDFLGSGVQGGAASSTPDQTVLSLSGSLVLDGSGTARCEIFWDGSKKLRDLQTGEVLMTATEVFLIDGDFDPTLGVENWQAADYTFRDHQIREGGWWGQPLLTADVHLEWTTGTRRLIVGALIEGLCGAPGLDAAGMPPHPEG